jgi:hypothetical protein
MCHFHYRKFDTCGDYGIEISNVCDEALWRAGLRGVLQICLPRILERSLEWSGRDDQEPPKPALFRGYDGFCEMCVTKFKVLCPINSIPYKSSFLVLIASRHSCRALYRREVTRIMSSITPSLRTLSTLTTLRPIFPLEAFLDKFLTSWASLTNSKLLK